MKDNQLKLKNIEPDLANCINNFKSSIAKDEVFWIERLANLELLAIPYAKQTAPPLNPNHYASIKMPVTDEVISFLGERHPTWNRGDFLFVAFVSYLARLGGIGCFDIGFKDIDLEQDLIGISDFFASHVPCHLEIKFEQSFESVFESVLEQVELTKQHKTYERNVVINYPALFSLTELDGEQIFSVVIERVENLDNRQAQAGNQLTFIIPEDGNECAWLYNVEALDSDDIVRMLEQFATFLHGIITDSTQPLAYLPLLSEEERHKILVEWNDTQIDYPKDKCIHQLFEEQVERTPDHVAVVFEDEQLTYRELNAKANQLAHYLQRLGVGPEVLVGICVERSLKMVVGLLGILKAGGAYVPLDPEYPKERLAFMLSDAQVSVLLTQQMLVHQLTEGEAQMVCLDSEWEAIAQESKEKLVSEVTAENLAYVIYTSGSTGKPKGVLVSHHNVVRLFEATQSWFHFNDHDVWTLFHSYAFDFSVWELWGTLFFGGRCVVIPYWVSRSPDAFYNLLCKEKVTVLNQTPSAFHQLIQFEKSGKVTKEHHLRLIIFGGEALQLESLKTWFERHGDERPQLVNMYGITETTVHVTYRPLTIADVIEAKGSVIGVPIPDLQVYVLDRYRQPVAIGVPGEMYIGGAGLSRGYLNRPELTTGRFIPNPFSDKAGAYLYKSGDLARYLPNGDLEYLGRIDHQVKIRGFRIELEEIESALAQHPTVKQSVVVTREDIPGDKRLVAYVLLDQEQIFGVKELRSFLQCKLPDHMVPSTFVLLDALPLTPNGKIDRHALPAPDYTRPEWKEIFVAPRTPTEKLVAAIWSQVLEIEQISVNDDFFDLGGHSLLATQVISRVYQAFNINISLRNLFEAPTVTEFCTFIETGGWIAPKLQSTKSNTVDGYVEREF